MKHNVNIGLRDLVEGFLFSLRAEGKSNGTIDYYSYYISDEKFPNALLIPPGFAGEIHREVSHQRNRYGAPAYEHGYVVEVTCRYGKDIPIYIPIHNIGNRATNLVEIAPLLIVDEAMYSSHIYKSQIKVISYRQLAEEVLPIWDKTKEWYFT